MCAPFSLKKVRICLQCFIAINVPSDSKMEKKAELLLKNRDFLGENRDFDRKALFFSLFAKPKGRGFALAGGFCPEILSRLRLNLGERVCHLLKFSLKILKFLKEILKFSFWSLSVGFNLRKKSYLSVNCGSKAFTSFGIKSSALPSTDSPEACL